MIPIYGKKNAGSDLHILYTVPKKCLFSSVRRVFINGMFTLKMTHLQMISHDLPIGHYRFSWFCYVLLDCQMLCFAVTHR